MIQMENLKDLKKKLDEIPPSFWKKDWITKNTNYEEEFSTAIGADFVRGGDQSLFDCTWRGHKIEIKKGKAGAWCNLVRYSKQVIEENQLDVKTLFIFYKMNKDQTLQATSISVVKMDDLINLLKLNQSNSDTIIKLDNELSGKKGGSEKPSEGKVTRHLNIQSRITKKEVEEKATYNWTLR